MHLPGGKNTEYPINEGGFFGPFSHGLIPFEASQNEVHPRNVAAYSEDVSEMSGVGDGAGNPFAARTMAFRAPASFAGWGYDLFGRPVPNLRETVEEMNSLVDFNGDGKPDTTNDYITHKFNDLGNGALIPNGGSSDPSKLVGGAVELRYDIRHGIWKGDPFIYAEIMGHRIRPSPGSSSYIREYEWREVEFGAAGADDPFRRNSQDYQNPSLPSIFKSDDSLDHPARTYTQTPSAENSSSAGLVNYAVNASEMGGVFGLGGRGSPILCQPVQSGSIVQLKSVQAVYPGGFGPAYIFDRPTKNTIFLKIQTAAPLTLGIDDAGTQEGTNGREDIGLLQAPVTRWLYTGVPVKLKSLGLNETPASNSPEASRYAENIGFFEEDISSYPTNYNEIYAINLTEYNNNTSIQRAGAESFIVAPGVDMASIDKDGNINYPSGFSIRPIAGVRTDSPGYDGTIVEASYLPNQDVKADRDSGAPVVYFSLANAHDGCCVGCNYITGDCAVDTTAICDVLTDTETSPTPSPLVRREDRTQT